MTLILMGVFVQEVCHGRPSPEGLGMAQRARLGPQEQPGQQGKTVGLGELVPPQEDLVLGCSAHLQAFSELPRNLVSGPRVPLGAWEQHPVSFPSSSATCPLLLWPPISC